METIIKCTEKCIYQNGGICCFDTTNVVKAYNSTEYTKGIPGCYIRQHITV